MWIEATLWLLTLGGFASVARFGSAGRVVEAHSAPLRIAGVSHSLADSAYLDSVASSADKIVSREPFRISHEPPSVPYSPELRGSAPPMFQSPPVVTRPNLSLRGIFGSRSLWRAVLIGVPGRSDGVLVSPGDTLGGLRVRRITRDTVFVGSADTSWKLTVRGGWQP